MRSNMKKIKRNRKKSVEIHCESPMFEVPLFVKNRNDGYVERHGRLDISGFYFETDEIPMVGQQVDVKIILLGLGKEVKIRARVVRVVPSSGHVGVSTRFEEIPFETERIIARWLDMLTHAHQLAVAV
jgi:hypothetical protein